jgi:hypothetical protein
MGVFNQSAVPFLSSLRDDEAFLRRAVPQRRRHNGIGFSRTMT